MDIIVKRIEDGPAKVQVVNPEDGSIVQEADVNVGQEVTVTTGASAENPPYIGEVAATPVGEAQAPDAEPGSAKEPEPPVSS